jgi:hypothetical protein
MAKGLRKRAVALPAELEREIVAQVLQQIELEEALWWPTGRPEPEIVMYDKYDEWNDDWVGDDDVPF